MTGPRVTSRVTLPMPSPRSLAHALLVLALTPFLPSTMWAQRTVSINGQVRTDEGIAVRSAMVRLETQEGELVEEKPVTTAGQFFFTNIPKSQYMLTVTADGFDTYREPLNLAEGADQYDLSVTLTPARGVAGAKAEPPALSDAQAPREAKHEYDKAVKAIDSRKYDEARKQLEAAVTQYPCYARAQTKLGLVMSQQKDYKEAEDAFRKSISCDAGYLEAYLNLGQLLNAEKRFGEAAPDLDQGLRQAPSDWRFYYESGVAQYGLKHYDLAEQELNKAKSLAPAPPAEIDAKLADVYLRENSFQKAYATMQDYLKTDPNGPFADRIRTIMKQMESAGVLQAQAPAARQQN
jgi:tetratricopeptide (TPR) repeat protein